MLYYSLVDISAVEDRHISLLSESIKHHFSYASNLKRKESVCAKAVLCFLLEEKYNLTDFTVDCYKNGKPYIKNSDVYFNLSHSGNYVLCVCGDSNVGCDVERIKPFKPQITKRFFTLNEHESLINSESKEADFTKLWTLKESVLKFTGEGIGGGLASYDFAGFLPYNNFDAFGYCFKCAKTDDYFFSICYESDTTSQFKTDINIIMKSKIVKN